MLILKHSNKLLVNLVGNEVVLSVQINLLRVNGLPYLLQVLLERSQVLLPVRVYRLVAQEFFLDFAYFAKESLLLLYLLKGGIWHFFDIEVQIDHVTTRYLVFIRFIFPFCL